MVGGMTIPSSDRAVAFSVQLAQAHQELRRRISRLQAGLGETDADTLAHHCLAFCAALTTHHRGEDTGMFAELARARPDLAGQIGKLVEDHEMIGTILERVADLAGRARGARGAGLARLKGELDGLAAIMESHFRFEERAVSAALDDGVADTGWTTPVFDVRG
jgi:hypothetical protein